MAKGWSIVHCVLLPQAFAHYHPSSTTPPVYRSGSWRVLDFQPFAAGPHCLIPEGASLGCRERLKIKPRQAQYTKWRSRVSDHPTQKSLGLTLPLQQENVAALLTDVFGKLCWHLRPMFAKAAPAMRMSHVLVGAFVIAGALALAGVGSRSPDSSIAPEAPPLPPAPQAAPQAAPAPEPAADHPAADAPRQTLDGDILETLDVPGYTYIRLGQKGAADAWVAVTTANVKVGEHVRFEGQTVMTNFTSPRLKRTFEQIHFGVLVGQNAARPSADPHGAMQDGPAQGEQPHGTQPHGTSAGADIPIGNIEKAEGPNGVRIAELFAQKKSLAGKSARVRGVVVKATNGVMGKNFLHLRDGSGTEAQQNHDLTVTTNETLEKGQTVVLEGTVTLDKDLGAGYRYDVLLEDATRPK